MDNRLDGHQNIMLERISQRLDHGFTSERDSEINGQSQLAKAASALIRNGVAVAPIPDDLPKEWSDYYKEKLCAKSYQERVVVAGALLAAEYDRIKFVQSLEDNLS